MKHTALEICTPNLPCTEMHEYLSYFLAWLPYKPSLLSGDTLFIGTHIFPCGRSGCGLSRHLNLFSKSHQGGDPVFGTLERWV